MKLTYRGVTYNKAGTATAKTAVPEKTPAVSTEAKARALMRKITS